MCAQNNVKWTLDARIVACKYLCTTISSDRRETKKQASKSMILLTLIKSDCYIAVAFDHATLWWEKNVRIIFTKRNLRRRWTKKKSARCMKAKFTNNFIVKREFVIIVDHIFCFFTSCFVSCSPMDFLSSLFPSSASPQKTMTTMWKICDSMIYLLCVTFLSFSFLLYHHRLPS